MSIQEQITAYEALGYRGLATDSGTGSTILVNEKSERAVKFNFDPAYDHFVSLAELHRLNEFPEIHLAKAEALDRGLVTERLYTITEMELLAPLTTSEQEKVVSWITSVFEARSSGTALEDIKDDPLSLLGALRILIPYAANHGIDLDLGKSTNYMVRQVGGTREFVITDPFN